MGSDCCTQREKFTTPHSDSSKSSSSTSDKSPSYSNQVLHIRHLPLLETINEASANSEWSSRSKEEQKQLPTSIFQDNDLKRLLVQYPGPFPTSKEARHCAALCYWITCTGNNATKISADSDLIYKILLLTKSQMDDVKFWSLLVIKLLINLSPCKNSIRTTIKIETLINLIENCNDTEITKGLGTLLYDLFLTNPQFLNQIALGMHLQTLISIDNYSHIFDNKVQRRIKQLNAFRDIAVN